MANDWIKMRVDLGDDPAVIGIAEHLKIPQAQVVGVLHKLWSWADRHSVDGDLPNASLTWLDNYVGVPNFGAAMRSVGWLEQTDRGIVFPNFTRHNGHSAKQRALAYRRVARHRAQPDKGKNCNADSVTKALPEKEKEKEKEYMSTANAVEGKRSVCPYQRIVDLYHETLPMCPRVKVFTDARKRAIKARWQNDLCSLEAWRNYFVFVSQSEFLTGRVDGRDGKPPFVADLEWLCKPSSFAKVAEGKYHRS